MFIPSLGTIPDAAPHRASSYVVNLMPNGCLDPPDLRSAGHVYLRHHSALHDIFSRQITNTFRMPDCVNRSRRAPAPFFSPSSLVFLPQLFTPPVLLERNTAGFKFSQYPYDKCILEHLLILEHFDRFQQMKNIKLQIFRPAHERQLPRQNAGATYEGT